MRTVLTTAGHHPRDRFRLWQAAIVERIVPVELASIGDAPFEGTIEAQDLDRLSITRLTQTGVRAEATPATIRSHDKHETVSVALVLEGRVECAHCGRESVQRTGEFVLLDRTPTVIVADGPSRSLLLEVPRSRLESVLGPAAVYAGLTVGSELASASLVATFFRELTGMREPIAPELASRLSSVGFDLLVAGIADRLTRDVPRPLAGTVLVQRAKAYVEANFEDPTLDPSRLAGAMGVSLRRLQQLFKERNRNISDWIWDRRLEAAAVRLADPGCAHQSIGIIAHGCGFADQSHFSRRFRDRFGMAPGEYRSGATAPR